MIRVMLSSVLRSLCFVFLLASAGFVGLAPQSVLAQVSPQSNAVETPNYVRWDSVAKRAEQSVAARTGSSDLYETLRLRIAGFRATFDSARRVNTDRIETLRSQIAALGAVPESGESEPTEIADRRAELNRQLTTLSAPIQTAEEAYTRADGIIRAIDTILRERQQERIFAVGPTPLNPVLWPGAMVELSEELSLIAAERHAFDNPALRARAQENLPIALLYLALGVVLLARGRRWASAMGDRLRQFGGAGTGVWSFTVSLLRIALPLAGVYALTGAVDVTGLDGVRTERILQQMPVWAALILGYRWLAEQLFSRNDDEAILLLTPRRRSAARFFLTLLAFFGVLGSVVDVLFQTADFTPEARVVISFPVTLAIGFGLFRFGKLLRGYVRNSVAEADTQTDGIGTGLSRVLRYGGLSFMVTGCLGPVMSALGYNTAGNMLIYPTLLSIGLLGLVLALQRFGADILGWVTGKGADARDSLLAVLMTFVLLMLAAPLLAVIWGARVADLTELWATFLQGFQIGGARISPTDFLAFVLLFSVGYLLTRMVQSALKTSVLPKTRLDQGAQVAMVSGVGYIGIFLSAIIAVTMAGIDLSALAIVAGALSVGIGFGLQNIVNNFVSGIILLIERPIAEGDWIEVGGNMGYVRNVSVRSTRIETFDRSDVIVPNSDLISGTVTNYTRGNTVGRVIVPVGVAYGTDTRLVEKILKDVAEAHPMVVMNPPPSVVFQHFGASSLDFEIRAILRDVNWVLSVKSEMNHEIAKRFHDAGVEIPFPQQDVWLRNPEALRRPPEKPSEEAELGAGETDTSEGTNGDTG